MRTSALDSDVVCVHFHVQIIEAVVVGEQHLNLKIINIESIRYHLNRNFEVFLPNLVNLFYFI